MRGFRGTRATLNQRASRYGRDHHENFNRINAQGSGVPQQKQRPELPDWIKAPEGLNASNAPKKERPNLRLVVNNTAPKPQQMSTQAAAPAPQKRVSAKPAVKAKTKTRAAKPAAKAKTKTKRTATKRKAA